VRAGLLSQLGASASPELQKAAVDDLLLELATRRWRTDPTEPHAVLAHAPIPVYITTTPDSLLAEALKAAGKEPREEFFRWNDDADWPPSIYDEDRDYQPSPAQPLVYHLFGRLGIADSLVITEDDYFDYLIGATRYSDSIPTIVRSSLTEKALLFLGFEMDGWDFRVLFRSIRIYSENQYAQRKKARIAHAGVQIDLEEDRILKPERAREYIESYFEESNVHIYWGSVADFARELCQQLAKAA
jgi:SIR2-like protein